MNLEIRLENDCPKDWNKNLLKSKMGNIFNTFEYSEYAKLRLNWNPMFLSILDSNGTLHAQSVIFEYARRKFGKKIPSTFNKLALKLSKTLKWIYGPVIHSENEELILEQFFDYVKKKGKKLNGTIHPFVNAKVSINGINLIKWSTFIIDLQQTEENILKNTDKKSVQKNIERSLNREVSIHEIDNKSIQEYHELLNEYRIALGYPPYEHDDTIKLWNLLKPLGFKGYLAKKDGNIIGGITFSFFNGYINEWGIARSKKDTLEKLYSQDHLKWKIIQWGIHNDQKFYDLSGINPNPTSEKESGILQYKKKWGGKQFDFWLIRK